MAEEISIKRRSTFECYVTYQNSTGGLPITDYIFFFTVKRCLDGVKDDSTALIKKDITVFTDGDNGRFLLSLSSEDTDIPEGDYYFDIRYTKPNGKTYIIKEQPLFKIEGYVTGRIE